MRLSGLVCAGLLLASCNMVTSATPLFSSADARQPGFRSGVWLVEDKTCAVDTTKPMTEWPDCADAWLVHPGEILAGRDPSKPLVSWTHFKTVLTRGDPAVMQIGVGPEGTDPGGFAYAGVRVLKTDAERRVVEYRTWAALCGPPPPPNPNGQNSAVLTDKLLPGLVADEHKQDCIASDKAPVLASVKPGKTKTATTPTPPAGSATATNRRQAI